MRDFYRHTGLALKARGITYLRTDHSGKDVAKGMRGSSAKNDDVDLVWQLTRTNTKNGDGVRLSRTHSRVPWIPQELTVAQIKTDAGIDYRLAGDVSVFEDGTRQAMEALEAAGMTSAMTQNKAVELARTLDIGQKKARAAWRMMRERDEDRLLTGLPKRVTGADAVENATASENGDAMGTLGDANDAPSNPKGSQRDANDASADAVEAVTASHSASPLGDADDADQPPVPDLF